MKLIYYFSFIIILYFFSIYLTYSGQWLRVDSVATNTYIGISCADTQNCTAIGHWGAYLRNRVSSDGGFSWVTTLQDSVTPDHLPPEAFSVAYPDTSLCIIALDSGYYWQSSDKCRTWEKKRYRDSAYKIYQSLVKFADKNHGAIVEPQNIYITSDGGGKWMEANINFSYKGYSISSLSFSDSNNIFVLVYRFISQFETDSCQIIKSVDGGQTWTFYPFIQKGIIDIAFIDSLNGWGVGGIRVDTQTDSHLIKYSSDGGRSWSIQLDTVLKKLDKYGLSNIKFIDKNNAIALGPWWHLWKTTDGGKRWLRDTTYNQVFSGGIMSDYFVDVAYLKNNTIIGVQGLGSSIYKWSENATGVIENSNSRDYFVLYPNPVSDILTLQFEPSELLSNSIEIYNILGVQVLSRAIEQPAALPEGGAGAKIDVTGLPPGIYYIRAGNATWKFVKL